MKMGKAGEIVKYQPHGFFPFDPRETRSRMHYVAATFRRSAEAGNFLLEQARHKPEAMVELLANADLPIERALKLLHYSYVHADFSIARFLFSNLSWELLNAYYAKYEMELWKDYEEGSPAKKVRALSVLAEYVDYMTLPQRERFSKGLEGIPTVLMERDGTRCNFSVFLFELRLRVKNLQIMEEMGKIFAVVARRKDFQYLLEFLIRHNLEFIPSGPTVYENPRTGDRGEVRVGRDYEKRGTAAFTMQSLLRHPAITEDEIKRLTGTTYCRNWYEFSEAYRSVPTWRAGGGMVRGMVPPAAIPQAMQELVAWVNSPKATRLHPLKRAAIFYARYDAIHPFTGATKHAARFFASKIMLLGRDGVQYLPLIDGDFFWLRPVMTKRPDPFFADKGLVVFGGGDFFGRMQGMLALAEEGYWDEYVFNFLGAYFTAMQIALRETPSQGIQKSAEKVRQLLSSECSEQCQHFFDRF